VSTETAPKNVWLADKVYTFGWKHFIMSD